METVHCVWVGTEGWGVRGGLGGRGGLIRTEPLEYQAVHAGGELHQALTFSNVHGQKFQFVTEKRRKFFDFYSAESGGHSL